MGFFLLLLPPGLSGSDLPDRNELQLVSILSLFGCLNYVHSFSSAELVQFLQHIVIHIFCMRSVFRFTCHLCLDIIVLSCAFALKSFASGYFCTTFAASAVARGAASACRWG